MKETPILMTGEMVRATLRDVDPKLQTRRIIKPQPIFEGKESFGDSWAWRKGKDYFSGVTTEQLTGRAGLLYESRSVYGQVGDRLWVREIYYQCGHWQKNGETKLGRQKWKFVPGSETVRFQEPVDFLKARSKTNPSDPAIYKRLGRFMPKKYCRLRLEITGVRVERVQDISEEDARAEGCEMDGQFPKEQPHPQGGRVGWDDAREWYSDLWEKINGANSWEKNPWVWVISFKRLN